MIGRYTPVAQGNLGLMHKNGSGVPQDHTEAVRLYQLATDQGTAQAQCYSGAMYMIGTGVPQDHTKAARLFQLATDQGNADAQWSLGTMYVDGMGFPQDHTKAAWLIKLAYDQGYQPAKDALGRLTAAYPAGTRVWITGLTTAANLNSRLRTAVRPTTPLAASRIAVRIDGQTKLVSLSWANARHV